MIEHVAVLSEPGQPIQPSDIPVYDDVPVTPVKSTLPMAIMDEPYHAAKDRLIAEFEKEYLTRLSARAGEYVARGAAREHRSDHAVSAHGEAQRATR